LKAWVRIYAQSEISLLDPSWDDEPDKVMLVDAASDLSVSAMPGDVVARCHRNFFTIINAS
jgi:hypothetical protein